MTHPDNVCIESLSIDLTRQTLRDAGDSVKELEKQIEECVDRFVAELTHAA